MPYKCIITGHLYVFISHYTCVISLLIMPLLIIHTFVIDIAINCDAFLWIILSEINEQFLMNAL